MDFFIETLISMFFQEIYSLNQKIGSGISLEYISNITVQCRKNLPKFGGCKNLKFDRKIGGVLNVSGGEKNCCLKDTINIGLNYKFCSIIFASNFSRKCTLKTCNPKKLCKNCHKKLTNKMTDLSSYPKPCTGSVLNKIQVPSSIREIFKIEKEFSDVKFILFDIVDNIIKKSYSTPLKNSEVKKIVPIVRILQPDNTYHYAFIYDLSLFLKQKYFTNSGKKASANTLLCPFCTEHVYYDKKVNNSESIDETLIPLKIKQILPFLNSGKFLKKSYIDHLNLCSCDHQTKTVLPKNKNLPFQNWGSIHPQKYSFFIDFESYNSKISTDLCAHCVEIISKTYNEKVKNNIINRCKLENHDKITDCQNCYKSFKSISTKIMSECCLDNPLYTGFYLCSKCFTSAKKIFHDKTCTHSHNVKMNELVPLSACLVMVNNFKFRTQSYEEYLHKKNTGRLKGVEKIMYFEGEKCVEDMLDFLDNLPSKYFTNESLPPYKNAEEMEAFHKAKKCYVCNTKFSHSVKKIFDHSHICGNFRGAACQNCNLQMKESYQMTNQINIYAHNFKGFDSHFLIQKMSTYHIKKDMKIIASNLEKIIGLRWGNFIFKDSLAFLPTSLDKLTESLLKTKAEKNQKLELLFNSEIVQNDIEKYELLLGKSSLPYECINSLKFCYETKQIPKIDNFYSSLSQKNISFDDYQRVKQIYNKFECANLAEFIKIYCILDTLLLAEVWSNFSEFCTENYNISPDHFYTLPSYGLQCMLIHLFRKDISLENIRDKKMLDFFKAALRGGFSGVGNSRIEFSKSFQNFSPDYFDDFRKKIEKFDFSKNEKILESIDFLENLTKNFEPKNSIFYLDANNLYGGSQAQKLPLKNFKWASKIEKELIFAFFQIMRKKAKIYLLTKNFSIWMSFLILKMQGFLLNVIFHILKIYMMIIVISHSYLKKE